MQILVVHCFEGMSDCWDSFLYCYQSFTVCVVFWLLTIISFYYYCRAYVRPAPVTEDGGFTVQQSHESSKGTVRFERQRSSLYSLRASPEAFDLVRSLPHDADSNGWHGLGNGIQHNGGPGSGFDEQNYVDGDSLSLSSGDNQPMSTENGIMPSGSDSDRSLSPSEHLASGIRPRVNSNKLISTPQNSTVVFQQSLSGRLEHSYSFELSHQPSDVMDENQQPWSGHVVKKRLFKGPPTIWAFLKAFAESPLTSLSFRKLFLATTCSFIGLLTR